jgi:hypothetical protein
MCYDGILSSEGLPPGGPYDYLCSRNITELTGDGKGGMLI